MKFRTNHATGDVRVNGAELRVIRCTHSHGKGKKADYSITLEAGQRWGEGLSLGIEKVDVDALIADLQSAKAWLANPEDVE